MPQTKQQPTNQEILTAINNFATHVEERFESNDKRFDSIDRRFEKIDLRFDKLEKRASNLEVNVIDITANMVTKDYLDEKLSSLKGELVDLIRKGNDKLNKFVNITHSHKLITNGDADEILSMEPFPKSN